MNTQTEIHSGSWAKSILKVGKWYVFASLFVKGVSALTLPIFSHYLTPAESGIYTSINSLKALFPLFISLALDSAFIRYFQVYKKDKNKLTEMFSTTFWFIFVFGIVCCIAFFFYLNYNYSIYSALSIALVVFPPLFMQLGALGLAFFNQSLESYKTTLFQILATVIGVGFSVYLVVSLKQGVQGRLIGDAFLAIVLMGLVVFYFVKQGILKFKFDKHYLYSALKFSLPILPTGVLAWINTQSAILLLQKFYPGQSVVGLFGIGASIASLMYYAIDAITQVLNPVVMSGLINDRARTHSKVRELMLLFTIIMLFLHLCIIYFSKELVVVFTANAFLYKEAYWYIAPLCLPYLFSIHHRLFNTIILFHQKTIYITYAVLACAVIVFGVNYFFMPHYGAQTPAFALLFGVIVMTAIEFMFARKLEGMNLGIMRYMRFIGLYGILALVYYLGIIHISTYWLEISLKIIIVILMACIFIYWGNYYEAIKSVVKRKLKGKYK